MGAPRLCALVGALLGLGGCVPFTVAYSPSGSGKVVDAQTKLAIPHAKVRAKSCPDQAVDSAADGSFLLKECRERRWFLALPMDIVPAQMPVAVEAPGYSPQTLLWDGHKPYHANVVIELHRQ